MGRGAALDGCEARAAAGVVAVGGAVRSAGSRLGIASVARVTSGASIAAEHGRTRATTIIWRGTATWILPRRRPALSQTLKPFCTYGRGSSQAQSGAATSTSTSASTKLSIFQLQVIARACSFGSLSRLFLFAQAADMVELIHASGRANDFDVCQEALDSYERSMRRQIEKLFEMSCREGWPENGVRQGTWPREPDERNAVDRWIAAAQSSYRPCVRCRECTCDCSTHSDGTPKAEWERVGFPSARAYIMDFIGIDATTS